MPFILREPGSLAVKQTLSTIFPDVASHAADIHLSPDGRFLYSSNHGDDSIAWFAVDQETGMLTLLDIVSPEGNTTRNFALTPGGRHLPTAAGKSIKIGTPVCVRPFIL